MVNNAVLRNIWFVVGVLTAGLFIAHTVDMALTGNWSKWWICMAYAIWCILMFRLFSIFRRAVRKGNVRLRRRK